MDAFLYRIKAAQRDLIERCGGIMRVVDKSGYSKSEVGRWNNASEPDLMPVGAIAVLERDCGQAMVTAVLAETNGRRLSDPEAARAAEISVLTTHAEVMRQSAELANAVAMAIADGQVTPSEAQTIDRIASSMERAASNMRASLASVRALGGEKASLKIVGGEA
jgi:predicted TIM-barrel enzyme